MMLTRRKALIGLAAPAIIRSAHASSGLFMPRRRLIVPATASTNLSFSVAGTGAFPGQPGNLVGFASAPGYPGSLTAMSASSIASGQTYNYKLIDNGSSGIRISATGVTFNGCFFGSSTGATTSQAHTTWTGGNNTCNYCNFYPSPSVTGMTPAQLVAAYSTWPSLTSQTLSASLGNDYGFVGTGGQAPPSGGLVFNSCDSIGFANGVVFSQVGSTNRLTFNGCWFHDSCVTPSGFHTDGVGDVQSEKNDFVQFLTINGCTIAVICNSNDIAFQPDSPTSWLFDNNTITNNYITSTASFVVQSGMDRTTSPPTNNVISGNTFSNYLPCDFGLLYENDTTLFSTSGSGNQWRTNMVLPGNYAQVGNVTSAKPYLWPNATANATDFTGPF